ncbi:hypothetical protein DPMN_167747 [Dreissena polymorpha]|uniref:Uncharacterized protein n=1 Tax=Dreissena polymorpha TaxID=45954 RepID=A0A9D4EZD9_DREPO|nr:hypothetical protein DPMN_167747 [Dreissena polymorpha]
MPLVLKLLTKFSSKYLQSSRLIPTAVNETYNNITRNLSTEPDPWTIAVGGSSMQITDDGSHPASAMGPLVRALLGRGPLTARV